MDRASRGATRPTLLLWGVPCPDRFQHWFTNLPMTNCLERIKHSKKNQSELLSFIKASIEENDLSSRLLISECLRDLIMKVAENFKERLPQLPQPMHTQPISSRKKKRDQQPISTPLQLDWTPQLIDVLRELLEQGADPTWIPQDHHESALFSFLRVIFSILAQIDKPLALELEKLLPFFLTEKCINHRESNDTVLHALLNLQNLPYLNEKPFDDDDNSFKKFKETISFASSTDNINATDCNGRTPLHLYIGLIYKIKRLPNILSVFDLLKTSQNVNMKDCYGRTPLHLVSIDLFKHDIKTLQNFLYIIYLLKTPKNVNMTDCDGRTSLHLLATELFNRDIETLPNLSSVFELLKTPENVNMKGLDGRTPLHLLVKELLKHHIDTIPNLLSIIGLLKISENLNDCEGRNQLHLLTAGLFEDTVKISEPISLFSLLLTRENVNCEDPYSMIPYSWILIGKAKWKDDARRRKLFYDIETKLIENGADAEKATSAAIPLILRLMEKEFGDSECTEKRLERLLGCMEAVANWEHHNYRLNLNKEAIMNLLDMKNTRWIAIVMKIMRVISKNKTTAQDIWDFMMAYNIKMKDKHCSLSIMEMLSIFAEAGAQPTDEQQLEYISSEFKAFTRNGLWAEPYLKILILTNKENYGRGKYHEFLSFLGGFYQISPKLVQLAKTLVHLMYSTWDECVESALLINCFLFITNEQEMLDDVVIEAFNCENWMKRSPLHLAVIFLNSLELLSCRMIKKYIEARDVHGCTPLHLAYLYQNEHAVTFLMGYVKDGNLPDYFDLTPRNMLSSIGEKIKKTYYEDCYKVYEAKKEVMKLLKPMIVMPVDEAEDLSNELKILFERLISKTKFKDAQIQIAGSMRERTKCGILDEADIQIMLDKQSHSLLNWEQNDLMQNLSFALRNALTQISWEGIHLRPIDVSGPWKLIWEGSGKRMQMSLDVVLIHSSERYEKSKQCVIMQEIIQGGPLHRQMVFQTLEPWNEIKAFQETMFASDWDIIDSLPIPCRLAIVIGKVLVQAYDCVKGNNSMGIQMPITSYTIKIALFCLLAHYESGQLRDPYLKDALEKVKGKKQRTEKLRFNPNAKWVNDEDLQEHREEARVWAQDIFLLIKFLAERKFKLRSYWDRGSPCARLDFGQAEYILELCDFALEKLTENAF